MNLVNGKERPCPRCARLGALQKPWIVPIPGTTKLERLEENLRSVDLEFTPEEWRDLNHAVSKIKLQGDRYPTDEEKQVGH